jgi:cytoskeletal protein RodZ
MNPNLPQDELLQRYEQAKAALPDGLPDTPPAALHERIMQAAREQVITTNTVASRADSMTAIGTNSLKSTPEAANDSIWSIKLIASLAVMGLSGLLWWQFEHGTPEEQEAAKSAKPSASIVAAAPPAPAPAAAPAAAPVQESSLSSAPSAVQSAAAPAPAAPSMTQVPARPVPTETDKTSRQETPLGKPSQAKMADAEVVAQNSAASPAPMPPGAAATEAARARMQETAPAVAAAPAPAPAPALPQFSQTDKAIAADVPSRRATPSIGAEPSLQRSLETAQSPSVAYVARPPAPAAVAANPIQLFTVIQAKDAAALRQALSQSTSPNARNAEGNPALHQAVIQRWPEGVRILLAAGADRNAKNNKGHTAADVALELGYSDMTELLVVSK